MFMSSRKGITGSQWAAIAIVLVIIIAVALGVYYVTLPSPSPSPTPTLTLAPTPTPTPTPTSPPKKVLVAFDVGGRGDKSFNDLAYLGAQKAAFDFGVEIDHITPATLAEMEDVLRTVSVGGKYDIILCIGFLWADALPKIADEFPDQKFGAIDIVIEKPNVAAYVYSEEQGSVLAGALAALVSKTDVVGMVLGMEIPLLYKFEIGYKFGVEWIENRTGRDMSVLYHYTGFFDDPSLGRETAIAFMDQGADVIYQVAGGTGFGALQAIAERAEERGEDLYGIGVDADQDFWFPGHILTSMIKGVEIGTYKAVEALVKGTFEGGMITLGLPEVHYLSDMETLQTYLDDEDWGGYAVQFTRMSKAEIVAAVEAMRNKIPAETWNTVDELMNMIINGEIVIPIATSENIEELRARYG